MLLERIKAILFVCCVGISGSMFAAVAMAGDGVVISADPNSGSVLLGELNCTACHKAKPGEGPENVKQAPILTEVGSRVTPQYLSAFLSNPHGMKSGTTMPDLLHGLPDGEKTAKVEQLTHYLASLGSPIDQRASGASNIQIERGKSLFHTVGCVACHQPLELPPKHKLDPAFVDPADAEEEEAKKPVIPARMSIPLGNLAMKTTVEQLSNFISDPLHVRPSGRMPKFNLQSGESRLIAAYLLREQYTEDQTAPGVGIDYAYYEGNYPKIPDFEKLKPIVEGEASSIDLNQIKLPNGKKMKGSFAVRFHGIIDIAEAGEYQFWTKSDDGTILQIDGEKVVDNDGHHPPQEKEGKINLAKGRHEFELGFTQGGGGFELAVFWQPPGAKKRSEIPPGVLMHQSAAAMIPKGMVDFKVDPAKASQGKELFASLGCAACHQTDKDNSLVSKLTAKDFGMINAGTAGSCISEQPKQGLPKFDLSKVQRDAIQQALPTVQKPQKFTAAQKVDHLMTTMNCYACHQRGEKGPKHIDYFAYEVVVDLGQEGRVPPPLEEVGAKLTDEGFESVLIKGEPYRTYMATRMPMFGEKNIGHFPKLVAEADKGKIPAYTPTFEPKMIDIGMQFVGKKNLSCINCHAWGPYRLPGAEGMNFLEAPKRLKPEWFHAFLKDPQKLKPRTRMPGAWPNGKSFFPDILDGNSDKQIDSIWAYLSVGEKGGIPLGLSPNDDTLLTPAQEPIVFRTFVDRVGAHTILVGFKQRTHIAFDANRVRTALAWTGNFVSTKPTWDGRAGQYTSIPQNNVYWFPDGPTFAQLESQTTPWPKDKEKQKLGSNRTPEGYQFKGYSLNDARVPTFKYSFNGIEIEETSEPVFRNKTAVLSRVLSLKSKENLSDVYLLVATGKQINHDSNVYQVDDKLKCEISTTPTSTPSIRESNDQQELLIPVTFVKGKDGYEAKIDLSLSW